MKLRRVTIEGFRSFAERTDYEFSERAGLFLVQGENGAGKSSFWDAVCWCFYGKTARGISGPHVESWHGDGRMLVAVDVEVDGKVVEIVRHRGPIRLTVDGGSAEQEVVDDLLAMDYARFLHVVLMGQFGTLFPDLRPTARLDLISDVLALDLWTRASKEAGKVAGEFEDEKNGWHRKVAGLGDRRLAKLDSLGGLEERAEAWEALSDQAHDEAVDRLDEARRQEAQEQAGERRAAGEVREAEDRLEAAERALDSLRKRLSREKENEAGLVERASAASKALSKARAADDAAADLQGATCPTCSQEVPDEAIEPVLARTEKEVAGADREYGEAEGLLSKAKREVARLREIMREEGERADRLGEAVAEAKKKLDGARRRVAKAREDRSAAEENLSRASNAENPYEDDIEAHGKDVAELDVEIEKAEIAYYDATTNYDFAREWPTLFKRLRLWVVDRTLDELAIHVNSSLVELGLRGWGIEFVVERENASGGTTRGFEILVHAPGSPRGVPWEGWSGGEIQRLRIACALGFANLIRSRMPSAPDFEVWDEPTAHLSRRGVEDLVALMDDRASDRQVWLVDHRALDSGAFDETLTISKTPNGTQLEILR